MHTGPVSGRFVSDPKPSRMSCHKCGKKEVKYEEWESSCGGYEDYHYQCDACGYSWWVEGPDA